MRSLVVSLVLAMMVIVACGEDTPTVPLEAASTNIPAAVLAPTDTPKPTVTMAPPTVTPQPSIAPTDTPEPTVAPPTVTPQPTFVPTETPEPIPTLTLTSDLPTTMEATAEPASTPTPVIIGTCAEEVAPVVFSIQFLPDSDHYQFREYEVSATGVRFRDYVDDGLISDFSANSPPTVAPTHLFTMYQRVLDGDNQWSDWSVEEIEYVDPELPENAPTFCGFTSDELSDLQYVGMDRVDEIRTRYYSATLNGDTWGLWVDSDGRPVKLRSSINGVDFSITISAWDEPNTISAPVIEAESKGKETPG